MLDEMKFPPWQQIGSDALREIDPQLVRRRVAAAETAIFVRLQELTRTPANFELEAMDAMLAELQKHATANFLSEPTHQALKARAANGH